MMLIEDRVCSIYAELTREQILQIAQLDAIIAIAHISDATAAPMIVPL
jgi:hypothetical protein